MRSIEVWLVTAEACHLCDHAKQVLGRLAERYPLAVSEIAWASEEGRRLAERDGVAFPPGIYLDGFLFGYGRLSAGKLQKWLGERRA